VCWKSLKDFGTASRKLWLLGDHGSAPERQTQRQELVASRKRCDDPPDVKNSAQATDKAGAADFEGRIIQSEAACKLINGKKPCLSNNSIDDNIAAANHT
jgi:hypothetical protein